MDGLPVVRVVNFPTLVIQHASLTLVQRDALILYFVILVGAFNLSLVKGVRPHLGDIVFFQ